MTPPSYDLLGISISRVAVAEARRLQAVQRKMTEPSWFWSTPFATWHLWEEAADGSEGIAKGAAVGICIASTLGACAGAGFALVIQDSATTRVETGEWDERRAALKTFQTAVLLVGGVGGKTAEVGMPTAARYMFRMHNNMPGAVCAFMCEP